MYVSLLQNAALLVALSTLYGLLARFRGGRVLWVQLLSGLLFGAAAVVGMIFTYEYQPGIFYDGRSIILAAAGLFSGGIGPAISVVVAGAYRAAVGGAGMWAGLATIVFTTLVGCGFRAVCRQPLAQRRIVSFYLLGLVAHVVMLGCQLLLPASRSLTVISNIWLPIMLIFPVATVLIGFLLRTEERRVEGVRQLARANERFTHLANELGAAVWTASPTGETIEDVNEAATTLSGLPLDSIRKDPSIWWTLVHPDDRALAEEGRVRVRQGGQVTTEYRIVRPDGETRWVRDNRSLILDSDGEVVGLGGIATDVTDARNADIEREMLRIQMLQSQKMEAVGRLAGGIAHDFNNLLTVINNYAALILADSRTDASLRDDVQQITVAGERAAQLTRQLLAFSRQQPMSPTIIDLNELVSEIQTMLSRLLGEGISVQTRLSADLWSIKADPGQVHQVLMNLVVNARDAMPEGGTLTISTENRDFAEDDRSRPADIAPGEWVSLSVADTGHGMTEEVQARLFEPFFTTKPMGVGTGLGLSTAYGIVAQSGGHIDVRSEPGEATVFTILIPRAAEPDGAEIADDTSTRQTTGETILVAEDEESVRRLTERILRAAGYTVVCAESGPAALEVADAYGGAIDLLLTDIVMPGLDGWELAARLRSVRPELKIVYMSGYSEDSLPRYAQMTEGVDFVPKPYERSGLLDTIRRALDTPAEQ